MNGAGLKIRRGSPLVGVRPPLPAPDNLQPFNHFTALLPSTWAIAKKSVFEKLGLFAARAPALAVP